VSRDLAAQLARWRQDRMAFRREAILLEDGTPFGEAIEAWQADDFAALDSGQFRHAYLERPRGHSKTGDVGTEAVAELLLGPPGQQLYCAAADEDQARLLFEDVAGKFRRNPLLRPAVRITQREIVVPATGSRLRVLASDAPTAYGLRPDWIAVDELAEWRRRELWDSLWTATGKRPNCRMVVITTAGVPGVSEIAWEVREIAQREPDWFFSARPQCAGWIRPEWLEQQRRTLPPHVFARLHQSQWVEGAGAFLLAEEVDRVFTDALPAGGGPMALGLDLGVTRDAAVLAVVRATGGLVVVDGLTTWEPRRGKVDLEEVEAETAETAKRLGAPLVLDPWQGLLMAQRLRRLGVSVVEFTFTPETRRKLFGAILDLIRGGRLRARRHDALRRELLGLQVEETATGWRVAHRASGHDDHVVAVGLAVSQLPVGAPLTGDLAEYVVMGPPRAAVREFGTGRAGEEELVRVDRRGPAPWDL
jgi:hypothetical protein